MTSSIARVALCLYGKRNVYTFGWKPSEMQTMYYIIIVTGLVLANSFI